MFRVKDFKVSLPALNSRLCFESQGVLVSGLRVRTTVVIMWP